MKAKQAKRKMKSYTGKVARIQSSGMSFKMRLNALALASDAHAKVTFWTRQAPNNWSND